MSAFIRKSLWLGLVAACGSAAVVFAQTNAGPPKEAYTSLQELRTKYSEPDGRIVTLDGVEVYYLDQGKGPALLMIHGSYGTTRTYDVEAKVLTGRGYRVIRYDMPPTGRSGPMTLEDEKRLAPQDIAQKLLVHLGVQQVAACVGVSSGGVACALLAAKYPTFVERLILSNVPVDSVDYDIPNSPRMDAARDVWARLSYRPRSYWDDFFTFYTEPDSISAEKRQEYYEFNRPPSPRRSIMTDLTGKLAAQVKAPTLLVWGVRDPLLVPAYANDLERYLRNSQVSKIFLPDVGHYPPLEAPERYAQIILTYLEAATPKKPLGPPPLER